MARDLMEITEQLKELSNGAGLAQSRLWTPRLMRGAPTRGPGRPVPHEPLGF